MLFIKIDKDTNEPVGIPVDEKGLRSLFPHIAFPKDITNAHLVDVGYECLDFVFPEFSPEGKRLAIVGAKRLADGSLQRLYQESTPSEEEIAIKWKELRFRRAKLLAHTVDRLTFMRWNALSEENKAIAIAFRQELLDMTNRESPYGYKFPETPDFLKYIP